MFNDLRNLANMVEYFNRNFQSSNQVPVEKATIRSTDWSQLKTIIDSLWEPDRELWEGLARDIVMWTSMYEGPARTGKNLYRHLRNAGVRIPNWLKAEIKDADFVPPKSAIALVIYRAMLIGYKEHPSAPGYEETTA